MIDALNYLDRLAPLYVVPGNHEFDEGDPAMLLDSIERSNFEWLGSNVTLNPSGRSMSKTIVENVIIPLGNLKLVSSRSPCMAIIKVPISGMPLLDSRRDI